MSERTLVLIKPDGVRRGLIGEIISRIERKGLRIIALEMRQLERSLVEEHYAEHADKPFFGPLVDFMTSGPVVAMIVEGPQAISVFRTLAGATDPVKAAPGTIRGDLSTDFGTAAQQNLVHGSDSPESAARELKLFFPGFFPGG
ncbi:nucleoside-diphosphate kinase [Carbonactinospora thermoautotrophica]|uniref:Nucleoside diphosphate kinase n=1 Tax=Carbonactinospora thermoautotrophica TaxID=1469144 RepID=A0A132MQI3_9ACTN|nr:nucleoside-diphosphate kinase [Carbonactinospora thermoautotrophica]KWX00054.1 nucleoside diphosphate kinase [Carbonactinospora thermoautotrophica]KWX02026.1 Nucleoside diphosphate kinase [Carbonactinospora thermoautotrophica]KWX07128.1 nucleoside diphosphate kinase [Carbonactinospora thermoautotrophica]MCX9189955.1 nucleoside-diphosphate kinase [Carbonactinospora thermoautotrophica]